MAGYHKSDVPGLFWLDRAKKEKTRKRQVRKAAAVQTSFYLCF